MRKSLEFCLHALLLGLLIPFAANGAPISELVNTGVNGQTGIDRSWYLLQNAETPGARDAYIVTNATSAFPFQYPDGTPVWAQNDTASNWISNKRCAGASLDSSNCSGDLPFAGRGSASGTYGYAIDFDLTGFDPASASISGRWMSDGMGTGIALNGVAIPGMTGMLSTSFSSFNDFNVTGGNFLAGKNTLVFYLFNIGDVSGIRIEVAGQATPTNPNPLPTPEPASVTLVLSAVALAGGASLRKYVRT